MKKNLHGISLWKSIAASTYARLPIADNQAYVVADLWYLQKIV